MSARVIATAIHIHHVETVSMLRWCVLSVARWSNANPARQGMKASITMFILTKDGQIIEGQELGQVEKSIIEELSASEGPIYANSDTYISSRGLRNIALALHATYYITRREETKVKEDETAQEDDAPAAINVPAPPEPDPLDELA